MGLPFHINPLPPVPTGTTPNSAQQGAAAAAQSAQLAKEAKNTKSEKTQRRDAVSAASQVDEDSATLGEMDRAEVYDNDAEAVEAQNRSLRGLTVDTEA